MNAYIITNGGKQNEEAYSLLLVLAMVLTLAACGGSKTAETQAPAAEAPAADEKVAVTMIAAHPSRRHNLA